MLLSKSSVLACNFWRQLRALVIYDAPRITKSASPSPAACTSGRLRSPGLGPCADRGPQGGKGVALFLWNSRMWSILSAAIWQEHQTNRTLIVAAAQPQIACGKKELLKTTQYLLGQGSCKATQRICGPIESNSCPDKLHLDCCANSRVKALASVGPGQASEARWKNWMAFIMFQWRHGPWRPMVNFQLLRQGWNKDICTGSCRSMSQQSADPQKAMVLGGFWPIYSISHSQQSGLGYWPHHNIYYSTYKSIQKFMEFPRTPAFKNKTENNEPCCGSAAAKHSWPEKKDLRKVSTTNSWLVNCRCDHTFLWWSKNWPRMPKTGSAGPCRWHFFRTRGLLAPGGGSKLSGGLMLGNQGKNIKLREANHGIMFEWKDKAWCRLNLLSNNS